MIDKWLHGLGYAYIGPNSLDRLTLVEIGYLLDAERATRLQTSGVSQSTMTALEEYKRRKAARAAT